MIARLAFSIATASNAETILLDEILAVGDSTFGSDATSASSRFCTKENDRARFSRSRGADEVVSAHDLDCQRGDRGRWSVGGSDRCVRTPSFAELHGAKSGMRRATATPTPLRVAWLIVAISTLAIPLLFSTAVEDFCRLPKLALFRAEGMVLAALVVMAAIHDPTDARRRWDLRKAQLRCISSRGVDGDRTAAATESRRRISSIVTVGRARRSFSWRTTAPAVDRRRRCGSPTPA